MYTQFRSKLDQDTPHLSCPPPRASMLAGWGAMIKMAMALLIQQYQLASAVGSNGSVLLDNVQGSFAKLGNFVNKEEFILKRTQDPILVFYSSDSTPLSARERYAKRDGDVAVVRFGKQCSDWLMHRVFLQDVQGRTTVVFSDPVPLGDKTAWSHWSAYRQLLPLPRELSHKGVVVHHHVFDRAMRSALTRHLRETHSLVDQQLRSTVEATLCKLMRLKTWMTSVAGKNHDTANGLKLSLSQFTSNKEPLRNPRKDLIASPRNS